MEIIMFALVWAWIAGETLVESIRSGEAPFILGIRVTRSESTASYWCSVTFWMLAFGMTIYMSVTLCLHALSAETPFRTRGLMPVNYRQWALAAFDLLFALVLAYLRWRKVLLRRLLREIADEEN